ncbi:MAG: ABC transporter ATP-binding protein [Rhodoferax sp.]|jgi:branched-chain amino acid transport system ATP-binding protein|nr:ABC transporter ATP-binding protein [Rhodoferax sp.]MCF8210427.1 ABC transporter ATP-binding protein [Rhodoferax sp.]
MSLLEVRNMQAWYGQSHVLHGVDLTVDHGEIVSLLGRNGVGRSTTCKTIMGLVRPSGSVVFKGHEIAGMSPDRIARLGLGYVPEDRLIFSGLTVEENLQLGIKKPGAPNRWSLGEIYELFPNLKERSNAPAEALSGGEQQMLTMCRSLLGDPDLMIIDEPTEGLSPQMVQRVASLVRAIADRGLSVLLVEQKLAIALEISHRLYVMGHGKVVFEGTPTDLRSRTDIQDDWLKV